MTFRILSPDGGGIQGLLSVRILQVVETVLEEKTGQKIHEYFEMMSGISTGSLLAGGIVLEMSTDDVLKIYRDRGHEILPDSILRRRKYRPISQLMGANVLDSHGNLMKGEPRLSTTMVKGSR